MLQIKWESEDHMLVLRSLVCRAAHAILMFHRFLLFFLDLPIDLFPTFAVVHALPVPSNSQV